VWFAIGWLIRTIEIQASDEDFHFYGTFVQLCFNSWPANMPFDRHSWWFSLGVSSRIVLILGSFIGIVGIVEAMIKQRKLPMRYIDVMKLRDNTIRDFFLKELPVSDEEKTNYIRLFDTAVEQANSDVITQLRIVFGPNADQILQKKQATENANL
jgi:hypothetical protein